MLKNTSVLRPLRNVVAVQGFHSSCVRRAESVDPISLDTSHLVRIRTPGKFISDPIDPSKRLGFNPLYTSPMGSQVAYTKKFSVGFLGLGSCALYLLNGAGVVEGFGALAAIIPLIFPIPVVNYLTKPYVTRIFRLYDKEGAQTYENITKDETLVIEQIGMFGNRHHATAVKVKDIRIGKERFGWVNWICKDSNSGELLKFFVADNVGGLKMDRIWGIIETNSGVDNGRGFLDKHYKHQEEAHDVKS
jgi:hypothetical protein